MGISRELTARQLAGQPDDIDYSRVAPLRRWCKENGFSPTTVYSWETAGHVTLVRVGHRTHIVLDTVGRMIHRLAEEQGGRRLPSSNPKVKARQAAAPTQPHRSTAQQRRGGVTAPPRLSSRSAR
jgi:hypothetical protein